MKKLMCLILALIFTVLLATMAMATTEEVDDPLVPQSSNTVTTTQYDEINEFDDDPVPESGPPETEITDDILPQTGGIPAEVFYVLGGILILSAVLLLSKKNKPSTK